MLIGDSGRIFDLDFRLSVSHQFATRRFAAAASVVSEDWLSQQFIDKSPLVRGENLAFSRHNRNVIRFEYLTERNEFQFSFFQDR